jgi:hypothetical protein
LFQNARVRAVEACHNAGVCCVHLQVASDLLIIAQVLHGLDDYNETLRSFATNQLEGRACFLSGERRTGRCRELVGALGGTVNYKVN